VGEQIHGRAFDEPCDGCPGRRHLDRLYRGHCQEHVPQ
jgi:hypothetical protein